MVRTKENFQSPESHPDCTHRVITAYAYEDKTPAAFWACATCGRRFEPVKPPPSYSYDTPLSMPRPVPKPSATKKTRGKKVQEDAE